MAMFDDRGEAGRLLGARLAGHPPEGAVVLGLPRGGVPVAAEVASVLAAPLDVLVVRKLGLPWRPEVAMGAVGEHGALILNEDVIEAAGVPEPQVRQAIDREREEVAQRAARFREGAGIDLMGRPVIVVDDGVATGATARAACAVARARGAARVVLAVPVAPAGLSASFFEADEVVCLHEPPEFIAVGMHYADFTQVEDAEVVAVLRSAPR